MILPTFIAEARQTIIVKTSSSASLASPDSTEESWGYVQPSERVLKKQSHPVRWYRNSKPIVFQSTNRYDLFICSLDEINKWQPLGWHNLTLSQDRNTPPAKRQLPRFPAPGFKPPSILVALRWAMYRNPEGQSTLMVIHHANWANSRASFHFQQKEQAIRIQPWDGQTDRQALRIQDKRTLYRPETVWEKIHSPIAVKVRRVDFHPHPESQKSHKIYQEPKTDCKSGFLAFLACWFGPHLPFSLLPRSLNQLPIDPNQHLVTHDLENPKTCRGSDTLRIPTPELGVDCEVMGSQLPDPTDLNGGRFWESMSHWNCPCSLKKKYIYIYTVYKNEQKRNPHSKNLPLGCQPQENHTSHDFRSNFLWSWWCHVVGSFEAFGHNLHFRRQTPTWVSSIPFPHLCLHKEPPSQSRLGLRAKSCHGKPPASDFPGRLCRPTWTFKNSKVFFLNESQNPKIRFIPGKHGDFEDLET